MYRYNGRMYITLKRRCFEVRDFFNGEKVNKTLHNTDRYTRGLGRGRGVMGGGCLAVIFVCVKNM